MRVAARLYLSAEEERQLHGWCLDPSTPPRLALRSRIVLRAAQGAKNRTIAQECGVDVGTVALWRRRFLIHHLAGIRDDVPRPGRKPRLPATLADQIAEAILRGPPPPARRWTSRSLAKALGTSQSTVVRVWKVRGLPRPREAKAVPPPTTAPRMIRDVEGVYLTPQNKAVVLAVYDPETRPPEPALAPPARRGFEAPGAAGAAKKVSNDLLKAVRLLYDANLLPSHSRHPHQEFLLFLRAVDHDVDRTRELFLLLESADLGTDRSISSWLRHHPRIHAYVYHPTSRGGIRGAGWPKELVEPPPRPGVSENFPRLVRAFKLYSETYKRHPRPFVWTGRTPDLARPAPGPAPSAESDGSAHSEPSALAVSSRPPPWTNPPIDPSPSDRRLPEAAGEGDTEGDDVGESGAPRADQGR